MKQDFRGVFFWQIAGDRLPDGIEPAPGSLAQEAGSKRGKDAVNPLELAGRALPLHVGACRSELLSGTTAISYPVHARPPRTSLTVPS